MPLRSLVSLIAPPLCVGCGVSAGRAEPLCSQCRRSLRLLGCVFSCCGVPVWSAFAYEGGARALVRALKFRGAAGIAATMGAQLAATAPDELLDGFTLVPVPLHPSRRRKRGFNQAERLAWEVAVRRDLPVVDCLERIGPRVTQVGRSRLERLDEIDATVRVRAGASAPEKVVVVDDVVTTGATMSACVKALIGSGTELFGGMAYAHALGR